MSLDRTTHAWTPDELDQIAHFIRKQWPARRIASVFSVSRNAVIGAIHRNENLRALMPKKPSPPKPPTGWVKPPKPKPAEKWQRPPKPKENTVLEPEPQAPDETFHVKREPAGAMRMVPMVELRADECRWPVTQDLTAIGGHLFCGRGTRLGEVYCDRHRLLATGRKVEH